jgi:hypothetical protein
MSKRTKSELERYVGGGSKDRLDIKAMVKEYFISERCSEILKLVVNLMETIPELGHDKIRLKCIKDFSKNFSKSKAALIEVMNTELVSYGGKCFKEIVFEEFVRVFNKTELVKDKLCFEKDAILFVEGCNIFNFEEDVKKKDLSSVKPGEAYKLGVLCGISGGVFEFLEKFLTGKRLEFYERARRSAVMVEQHGTADLYEEAKALARKLWEKGELFNHKRMAKNIIENYPEFSSLKVPSLADKLKDVGDEEGIKLTKGRPGYRAKEAIE